MQISIYKKISITIAAVLVVSVMCIACGDKKNAIPRPHGFFRIDFDKKEYVKYERTGFPYSFEYPAYAAVEDEIGPFAEPYWVNILIKKHNAQIHISYKKIDGNLQKLLDDSYELAYKHAMKASAINERLYENPETGVYGTLFEIKGNAASPMQFHLTDSTRNFIRGSFYISEIPNYDSLLPVIQFVEEDVTRFIESLNWE